jgi:hypothetical protein
MADFSAVAMPEVHSDFPSPRGMPYGTETGLCQRLKGAIYTSVKAGYSRADGAPPPAGLVRNGGHARFFSDDFYYRIHFFPHILQVGNVTRDNEHQIEIFNAWFENVAITSITPANNQNISGSGFDPPQQVLSQRSVMYYIFVGMDGPGTIDAVFRFTFSNGYAHPFQVVGQRLVIFAFPPNWESPVTETLSFYTDILESRDGTEQRIIMRAKPRYTVEYTLLESDMNQFDGFAVGWGEHEFVLPLWWLKTRLLHGAAADESTVYCDARDRGLKVGSLVCLWRSPAWCDTAEVSQVTDSSVTFTSGLPRDYPSGFLIPTRLFTYAPGPVSMEAIQSGLLEAKVAFESSDLPEIEPAAAKDTWNSRPVSPYLHDWSSPRARSFEWRTIENDSAIGRPYRKYLDGGPRDVIEIEGALLTTHAELEGYKAWLMYNQGRARTFYMLLKESHFQLTRDIEAETSVLFVKSSSYWMLEYSSASRMNLFLKTRDGRRWIFSPTSYSLDVSGDVVMNVNITFSSLVRRADVLYIGFVLEVRFDQDEFSIEHEQDIYSRVGYKLRGMAH